MKKTLLTAAAIGCVFAGIAQDKYVTSAATALSQKAWEEAKTDIDRAMQSPETNTKPKALYVKAQIYFSLDREGKYLDQNPYREATQALVKLAEVKPDYEKEEVTNNLFYGAVRYFNDANTALNGQKYADASESYKQVLKIKNVGGGKRFDKEKFPRGKAFDTMAADASLYLARIAYFQKNYEEAISAYDKIKTDPIARSAENYIILLQCYDLYNTANGNKKQTEEMAAVAEARTAFPDNPNIRNMEINVYLKYNKLSELTKKMEEMLKTSPDNGDVNYNLALLYLGAANPKEGGKPANASELFSKAEACFKKALAASPENANYAYNFGTLYYLQAYDVNEQMNAIAGTTAADTKKYDALKKQRDDFFSKALPNMEKANSILSSKTLNEGDKDTYRACLTAMKQIYAVQDNTAKKDEVARKLDALDK